MLSVSAWKRCALLHVNGFTYGPLTPLLAYFMAFLGSAIGLQSASRARAAAGASRVRWLTMASLAQDQCRNRAQIDYMICQQAYSSEGINCFYRVCNRPICAPTAIRDCEADYRRCFAGCGGTVVEEPRCVANCPS